MNNMFTVYVLYSEHSNSFYKGQTNNIVDRVLRHNHGYEKSTMLGRPWVLIWRTSKETRSEAKRLEATLKNFSRARLIQFMCKYPDGFVSQKEIDFLKGIDRSQNREGPDDHASA